MFSVMCDSQFQVVKQVLVENSLISPYYQDEYLMGANIDEHMRTQIKNS